MLPKPVQHCYHDIEYLEPWPESTPGVERFEAGSDAQGEWIKVYVKSDSKTAALSSQKHTPSSSSGEGRGVQSNSAHREVRFNAHGSPYLLACIAYACECANQGEAWPTTQALVKTLQLPEHKYHCAVLVSRVIQA
jgi:hypothetical protein